MRDRAMTAVAALVSIASVWDEVLERQHGVVTRKQALSAGLTPGAVRARLKSGRWRAVHAGVYATFTGPLTRPALLWAALLASGRDAVLSHQTAAELSGLIDAPADDIHVTVPADRAPRAPAGVHRHLSVRARSARHPTRLPPQTRIEETVVDLTQSACDAGQAVGWVVRACARRLTTTERLRSAFAARAKLRWRADLLAALDDVGSGCHSMVEIHYRRNVERRHGLPTGKRQAIRIRRGGRWYDDVLYRDYRTIVELDGPSAHPEDAVGRDRRRDNAGLADGLETLRYGPEDVSGRPCGMAAEIARQLRRNGWPGFPRPCGPNCVITSIKSV